MQSTDDVGTDGARRIAVCAAGGADGDQRNSQDLWIGVSRDLLITS